MSQQQMQEMPMTEKEAKMLLDSYQQEEDPKSIWAYANITAQDYEVLKDW